MISRQKCELSFPLAMTCISIWIYVSFLFSAFYLWSFIIWIICNKPRRLKWQNGKHVQQKRNYFAQKKKGKKKRMETGPCTVSETAKKHFLFLNKRSSTVSFFHIEHCTNYSKAHMGCWNVSGTGSKIEGIFIPETSGVEGAFVFHMQRDT